MPLLEQTSLDREQSDTAAEDTPVREGGHGFGRYLLTTGIVLLILYSVPLYLVRRTDFDRISTLTYSLPLNYAFQMKGQNADVVLFGDSTVTHGIDPSQMSRELGVKVVNLPNTGATLRVMNDLSLQRYLAGNRPPRLIVFYFAPWDADYLHQEWPLGTYEGLEVLAHQGTPVQIFAYVKTHPTESLQFPFEFYLANEPSGPSLKKPNLTAGEEVVRTQGHFTNPSSRPVSADCEFPPALTDNLRFDSEKALGAKYATAQTKVLFVMAPVPECRNASAVVDRSYSALPAAPPLELPRDMFSGLVLYLHPAPSAVPAITEDLVKLVRPVLGQATR
jgi:hypothetical protein